MAATLRKLLILALPVGLLTGCATQAMGPQSQAAAPPASGIVTVAGFQVNGDGTQCAPGDQVRDFRVVDPGHLILDTYAREYLLRVDCPRAAVPGDLLGYRQGRYSGALCPGDPLIATARSCTVSGVWRLPKDQVAAAPATGG